jgi:hypothetical protein
MLETEAELVASVLEILGQGVHWVRLCKFVWGCASLFETAILCEVVQVCLRLCKFMWGCASLYLLLYVFQY